jgi:hypothetical protein
VSEDQDWRLEGELDRTEGNSALAEGSMLLDRLVGLARTHTDELTAEIEAAVSHDVVISHDGRLLFAYATSREALEAARGGIEGVLAHDGIEASFRVSHWDDEIDDWRQIDPPASGEELRREQAEDRDAEAVETRTLVAGAGKLIRDTFEQAMLRYADELGLECEIAERHPHLMRTQVAFSVTGPKRKIDEFARGLRAEGWATVRAEGNVLNPL